MKTNINLYKYQKENETLRQENAALRHQLEKHRPCDMKLVSESGQLKWTLADLLALQRARIDSLEAELAQLRAKHTGIQKEQAPAEKLRKELAATTRKAQTLQENLDQLTARYATELATLKAKVGQQAAELEVAGGVSDVADPSIGKYRAIAQLHAKHGKSSTLIEQIRKKELDY